MIWYFTSVLLCEINRLVQAKKAIGRVRCEGGRGVAGDEERGGVLTKEGRLLLRRIVVILQTKAYYITIYFDIYYFCVVTLS